MSKNPYISQISQILASDEGSGSLATILFENYTAIFDSQSRNEYVAALIGELLLARAMRPR